MLAVNKRLICGMFVAGILASDIAISQNATLEEVIVTARKREESLLEVPFAITAFTAEALEQYDFEDFNELQYVTPGFTFVETGIRQDRSGFSYILRGINVASAAQPAAAATLFVDGAPVVIGRLSSFQDAARVEVLKGPQTAYFGRNTFAGAINVVTKNPGNEWVVVVSGELAKYDTSDIDVSVEGPILEDTLSFRVNAKQMIKGGHYSDNAFGRGDIGRRETRAMSGTLYFTPSDQLAIKVFGEYSELDDGISAFWDFPINEFGNCNPGGGAVPNWYCGVLPDARVAETRIGVPAIVDDIFIDRAVTPFTFLDDQLTD